MDDYKNFSKSYVAAPPSPATSGTSLSVLPGEGALFPAPPFNLTVWPAAAPPLATNAEISRVIAKVGDVFTLVRNAEAGGINRAIVAGDQVAATVSAHTLDELRVIPAGAISDAEVSASAGIQYSKLALGGSIVDGDIVGLSWSKLSGTPTTLAGYGITDAQPLSVTLASLAALSDAVGVLSNDGSGVLSWVAGGAGLSGAGTAGTVAKWSSSSALTDSIMSESGTVVTIVGSLTLNGPIVGAWNGSASTDENLGLGVGALSSLTTGIQNTALGWSTLAALTTGRYNTAVGANANPLGTTLWFNTAVGAQTLAANTGGQWNTVVGAFALSSNTGGNDNVAVGFSALGANQGGINNVAIGSGALVTAVSADSNTAIGRRALALATGGFNTALGFDAGKNISGGDHNVCLGAESGFNITTGIFNTMVGSGAGSGVTTGSYNTIIGQGVVGLAAALSNSVIIADGNGQLRLCVDAVGRFGIDLGVGVATAMMHLPAGAAGAGRAPLKFEAGVLLAAPELGALEFVDNGTTGHLYLSLNVAGVLTRVQIV